VLLRLRIFYLTKRWRRIRHSEIRDSGSGWLVSASMVDCLRSGRKERTVSRQLMAHKRLAATHSTVAIYDQVAFCWQRTWHRKQSLIALFRGASEVKWRRHYWQTTPPCSRDRSLCKINSRKLSIIHRVCNFLRCILCETQNVSLKNVENANDVVLGVMGNMKIRRMSWGFIQGPTSLESDENKRVGTQD